MSRISVVIRDHHGLTGALSLLKVINERMGHEEVEFVVICDGSSRCNLNVKGKQAKKLTVASGQLDTPYALNLGAEAVKSEVVIFTVGEAIPVDGSWLEAADRCCHEPSVAGVCGPILPAEEVTLFDRMYGRLALLGAKLVGMRRLDKLPFTHFSPLNMAIDRRLWLQHPFQTLGDASSSTEEWSSWAFGRGYDLVYDWAFAIRYSARPDQLSETSQASGPVRIIRSPISNRTP